MVREKYGVRLTAEQRDQLEHLVRAGKSTARVVTRARILLKTDQGWLAPQVAQALDVVDGTVYRYQAAFRRGWHGRGAQGPAPGPPVPEAGRPGEAHLIALACSPAPEGHDHWTLPRLLAGKVVELGLAPSLSHETVRLHLKKTSSSPGRSGSGAFPKVSAEFVAHMEDVLDLYAEPYDSQRPVVCFDETSSQLLAETRPALPARPGIPLRQDYEYRREGTRNLFMACEPLAGWRQVAVTQRRTMQDFAHQMRWLVDEAYPEVPVVRVVLDNLNTHRTASLYETFPAAEARRIAKRLEFHYTPKHGSWLNMAEIEFSVLSRCCLKRRLADEETLQREVQALVTERNATQATINWQFNTQDARSKLHRLYLFDSKID